MAVGAAVGSINGLLIGYLKARPFLTTLVTLIILRASVNILNEKFATVFATNSVDSDTWDFLGEGYVLGVPDQCRDADCRADHRPHLSQPLALRLASDRHRRQPQGGAPRRHSGRAHAALHLCAVGHALRDRRRLLCRAAEQHGFDDRLPLGIPGPDRRHPGRGLACRRQGHRLARHARRRSSSSSSPTAWSAWASPATSPRGSSASSCSSPSASTSNGPRTAARQSRRFTSIRRLCRSSISPSLERGSNTPFAQNDRLVNAEAIGLDQVEGPEDVILDRHDRLYGSTRDGNIIRFSGPNFEQRDVFAHIGGRPLGMQFDKDENLIVAVAGMGVYGIKPDGDGLQGDRRDQPHLVQAERRQPVAHGRRSRHSARRQDLFQRLHHALRDDDQFARHHGRAAERPPRRLRSRHQEDLDRDQSLLLSERDLRVA